MMINPSVEEINENISALERFVKAVPSHGTLHMGVGSDDMNDYSSMRVKIRYGLIRISDKEDLHSEDVDCSIVLNS